MSLSLRLLCIYICLTLACRPQQPVSYTARFPSGFVMFRSERCTLIIEGSAFTTVTWDCQPFLQVPCACPLDLLCVACCCRCRINSVHAVSTVIVFHYTFCHSTVHGVDYRPVLGLVVSALVVNILVTSVAVLRYHVPSCLLLEQLLMACFRNSATV